MFERDSVDRFEMKMADVGAKPRRIMIGHDGSAMGAGWHLAEVKIKRIQAKGKTVAEPETTVFSCG